MLAGSVAGHLSSGSRAHPLQVGGLVVVEMVVEIVKWVSGGV